MLTETKPKLLRIMHPNAGITEAYNKRLSKLIEEMHNSVLYWLRARYRQNTPEVAVLAQDSPVDEIRNEIRTLARRWLRRFNATAPKLAEYFATSVQGRSDTVLRRILRDSGISVKFQMGPAAKDALGAIVAENVALIKSIPEQYLTQVAGLTMRSVQSGRDLQFLTTELQKQFGVAKRRAVLIAKDQNNKATSGILRIRQMEVGIKQAVWMHSHAGKTPRPTHVANHGKVYDVANGWPDPALKGKLIWPGTEINCRCTSKAIVPGFD